MDFVLMGRSLVVDAIIISDIHIGADNCQARTLVEFLEKIQSKEIDTKRLILNGDVFENFNSRLHKWHWKILSAIRKVSDSVEVIWIRGNHDAHGPAEFIAHLIGASYQDELVFESGGKGILCFHGDIYDDFLSEHPILTWFGDIIYWFLQKIDGSFFLAKMAKHNSKTFLRCTERIKKLARKHKEKEGCDFVCCGHTHLAEADGDYYNSGTWTESLPTYLVVKDGEIKLETWAT
jgi:UDP-2,3-diacylglucosamine pyrophosphatase LpxH